MFEGGAYVGKQECLVHRLLAVLVVPRRRHVTPRPARLPEI